MNFTWRVSLRAGGCVAAVAACALAAAAGPGAAAASPAAPHGWRIVSSGRGALLTVTAPGASDVWAFGSAGGFGKPEHPVARHWNGHRWTAVSLPGGITGGIGCSGSTSRRDVWAFGGTSLDAGGPTAAVLRLRNGRWTHPRNLGRGYITGCAVISPRDVWVFGSSHVGLSTGTWHLDGGHWTHITTVGFTLDGASVVSARDIWATGQDAFGTDNVVAHWNGHRWTRNRAFSTALPHPSGSVEIMGGPVTALSARDVWAETEIVKRTSHGSQVRFLVQHWNGKRWLRVRPGSPGYYLPGAVRDGSGGWWAEGPGYSASHPSLLHRVGQSWDQVRVPIPARSSLVIFDLVRIPRTRTMLAAGWLTGPGGIPGRGVVLARQ